MNLITVTALTMSSQEIAELVKKRHDNVKRTIETLATGGSIQLPQIEEVKNHLGQTVEQYLFSGDKGKRDSFVVVAQLSPEFTGALVDRWQELEGQPRTTLPEDLPGALRLAADLAEQKAALALENLQQAQTIASLESLFMTGETPTQFCKRLNGVNCSRVNSSLLALGWLWNAATEENSKPRYRVAGRVRDRYLTERPRKISSEGSDSFIKYDLILLIDGARRLHQLYMKGDLAMKSKWDGLYTQAKYNGSDAQ